LQEVGIKQIERYRITARRQFHNRIKPCEGSLKVRSTALREGEKSSQRGIEKKGKKDLRTRKGEVP